MDAHHPRPPGVPTDARWHKLTEKVAGATAQTA